ncbi:MFS monocarboxylate transporter [Colletotrichum higginsianum]|nr:MFS monocarboxylate transporter [Colletotrichum higginsianum]
MARALLDPMILRNPALCLTAMGAFFMEWGLFVPLSYLTLYALGHGQSSSFSYMLLALINAGAMPGRWVPGYLSDRLGRFNMLIATILGCGMSLACLWLTSGSSPALLIAFAVVFGFFSGGNVSLAPVCIGQLCTIESYGRYYSTANVLGSFRNLIIFTIVSYAASFICLIIAML